MSHATLLEPLLQRICADLAMIADKPFVLQKLESTRVGSRVAGARTIHISFKLGFQHRGRVLHGCLLMPLPDAIALAAYLMLVPDDAVKPKRSLTTLDSGLKDAMIEIGNFVSGAVDAALRESGMEDIRVRSESCQGVKPNVRPAFVHEEGAPLLIGKARLQLAQWPAFDAILQLPELEPATSTAS
ncbi:MAG: hypothetical protein ACKO32_03265 [Planctomycetia bacterium]